jgi:hypothetical protein
MAKTRANMKLNTDDKYFLNNLKNRRQWLDSKDEFHGDLTDDEWYMISDYLFRLAKDYTAYVNNKKMHDNKKEERVADVKRCAESVLRMANIQPIRGDNE